jgi:isoleucyl-tRNA synthetase
LATAAGSTDHKAYSATLLLPKTTLPLKHKNAVAAELVYRSRTTDELYQKQVRLL